MKLPTRITVNRSILLPARSETRIPVSCMEQGRWHSVSDAFKPSTQHSPAAVRRKARESEAVYAAMNEPAPYAALSEAQSDVWESIAEHADKVGGHSDTGRRHEAVSAPVSASTTSSLRAGSARSWS